MMNCNFPPQHSSEQLFAKSSIYFPSSDHIPRSEAKIIHVDRKFRENRPERLLFHYEELMFDMTSLIKLYRLNERDFEKYILFFPKINQCFTRTRGAHAVNCISVNMFVN